MIIATHHTGKPTLAKLLHFTCADRQKINIAERIGINYIKFGSLILPQDTTGDMVRNIEHTCHSNPERINTEILREWLTGKGKQPVTWNTLIVILDDIGLSALASDIRTITSNDDDSCKPTTF